MSGEMKFDYNRTAMFMSYGLLVNGPLLHITYSKVIPCFAAGTSLGAVGKKMLFTQTVFSWISIGSFYLYTSALEKKGIEGTKNELREKMMPTMFANWKAWPLLQLINFAFVPPPLQVLYVNFMQIWWNAYLSFVKNQARVAEASNEVDFDESIYLSRKLKSVKAFEMQAADQELVQQIAYQNVETLESRSVPNRYLISSIFNVK